VNEAAHLCSPAIRKLPIAYPRHGSITPVKLHGRTAAAVHRTLAALARNTRKGGDLEAAADAEALAPWILGNRWIPPMRSLVDQVLAVTPPAFDPA
jgi:hypothetical protein